MGARKRPHAFTANGIAMLSSVFRSQTAVDVNIRIMRAFTGSGGGFPWIPPGGGYPQEIPPEPFFLVNNVVLILFHLLLSQPRLQ